MPSQENFVLMLVFLFSKGNKNLKNYGNHPQSDVTEFYEVGKEMIKGSSHVHVAFGILKSFHHLTLEIFLY